MRLQSLRPGLCKQLCVGESIYFLKLFSKMLSRALEEAGARWSLDVWENQGCLLAWSEGGEARGLASSAEVSGQQKQHLWCVRGRGC